MKHRVYMNMYKGVSVFNNSKTKLYNQQLKLMKIIVIPVKKQWGQQISMKIWRRRWLTDVMWGNNRFERVWDRDYVRERHGCEAISRKRRIVSFFKKKLGKKSKYALIIRKRYFCNNHVKNMVYLPNSLKLIDLLCELIL